MRPTKLLLVLLLLFIDSGRNSQLRAEPPLKAKSNVPCVSKAPSHYGVMSWEKTISATSQRMARNARVPTMVAFSRRAARNAPVPSYTFSTMDSRAPLIEPPDPLFRK